MSLLELDKYLIHTKQCYKGNSMHSGFWLLFIYVTHMFPPSISNLEFFRRFLPAGLYRTFLDLNTTLLRPPRLDPVRPWPGFIVLAMDLPEVLFALPDIAALVDLCCSDWVTKELILTPVSCGSGIYISCTYVALGSMSFLGMATTCPTSIWTRRWVSAAKTIWNQ